MGEETHRGRSMSQTQQWVSLLANDSIVSTSDPLRAWNNEIFSQSSSHMNDWIVAAAPVQPIKEEDHPQDSEQPLEHFSSNIPSSLLNNTEGGTCPPFPMMNQISGHLLLFDNSRIKKPSHDSCSFSFQQEHLEKPMTSRITPLKVRKNKLGDRISTLQQQVSPSGKTDAASVLLGAIEYIKCLHEQLTELCSPYVKMSYEIKKEMGGKEDLRSRGLCLVPISTICNAGRRPPSTLGLPWLAQAFGEYSYLHEDV